MPRSVKIRNINPIGDVTIIDPDTGGRIDAAAGAVIDVTPELAERLLIQTGNFEPTTEDEGTAK